MLSVLIVALGALYLAVDPFAFRAYKAEELAIRGDDATLARRAPRSAGDRRSDAGRAWPRARSCRSSTSTRARPTPRAAPRPTPQSAPAAMAPTARAAPRSRRRSASRASFRASPASPPPISTASSGASRTAGATSAAMPPLADGLTEADWTDIAVHLEHLAARLSAAARRRAATSADLGRSVATVGRPERGVSPCWRCHGPNGIGVAPYFPALIGQYPRYIAAQIIAFRGGQRRNAMLRLMDPVAHGLEPKEIEAVAGYYAGLRPGARAMTKRARRHRRAMRLHSSAPRLRAAALTTSPQRIAAQSARQPDLAAIDRAWSDPRPRCGYAGRAASCSCRRRRPTFRTTCSATRCGGASRSSPTPATRRSPMPATASTARAAISTAAGDRAQRRCGRPGCAIRASGRRTTPSTP